MNRPVQVWWMFAACAGVAFAALVWVTAVTLRLDRLGREAALLAQVEEKVRLALWRMDSAVAPLLTEESARPYFNYQAFHEPDRAYTKSYAAVTKGDVVIPSPLLNFSSSNILLHFEFGPDGRLSSPQAPVGRHAQLAESGYVTRAAIASAARRLQELQGLLNERSAGRPAAGLASRLPERAARERERTAPASSSLPAADPVEPAAAAAAAADRLLNRDVLATSCQLCSTNTVPPITLALDPSPKAGLASASNQVAWTSQEQQARSVLYQQLRASRTGSESKLSASQPVEGDFAAHWVGPALVLARYVTLPDGFRIQGCWLNWPAIRQTLLEGVRDLLPHADLQPAPPGEPDGPGRQLVTLPVRLLPGLAGPTPGAWTPVRLTLAVAWAGVLLAAGAIALLLHGALSLSERRAAFVSAVTHELRTPLTTFRMYSEMLAAGMVTDEGKRRHYLETLCSEANRLSHLVENVLAYARLERGSARSRVEQIPVTDLVARVQDRLRQRAELAGLELQVDTAAAAGTVVHVDVGAVEQILFNLVDNACKYAGPDATQKQLHLEALPPHGRHTRLRVRDHGPGICSDAARRLFQPFSKSAHEAAHSAPGVGLGLALCRRLSRSMGGDLRLEPGDDKTGKTIGKAEGCGARFVLSLPVSTGPGPGASI